MGLDMYLEADIRRGDPDPRAKAVFEAIDLLFPKPEPIPAGTFPGDRPNEAPLCEFVGDADPRIARIRAIIAQNFPVSKTVDNHWIGGYFSRDRVQIPLMYWRKANQIHAWFVEKVQDGRDECHRYEVSRERLFELRKLLKTIQKDPEVAPQLLPTQEGFFFGTYEYDDWYFENLKYTRAQLDRICESGLTEAATIHYQARW